MVHMACALVELPSFKDLLSSQMQDPLSERYQRLLHGVYDCVDRIVLNAYFRPGHSGGGFERWWRELWGSDDKLDTAHLMRMAGRFSRRVRAFAKATRDLAHVEGSNS
jgi:hypothetical protein